MSKIVHQMPFEIVIIKELRVDVQGDVELAVDVVDYLLLHLRSWIDSSHLIEFWEVALVLGRDEDPVIMELLLWHVVFLISAVAPAVRRLSPLLRDVYIKV